MYICDYGSNIDDIYQEELNYILMGDGDVKTSNGFTLFEKTSEIGPWLKKQKVTRKVNRLQVHHMGFPSYSTWKKTDKKVFDNPYFGRTKSLDSYGKSTWGSKSANGKYIAQHFNVFPDGKITTGRSLNSNPIGITGWNTGAICVEIYGDFDKGNDTMTSAQKKAVIALYGELCKRFDITPSASTIRYHAWFTSGGTYLGDYKAGKSRKTCPGTAFFGGNTMAAFKKNFLPAIQQYIKDGTTEVKEEGLATGVYKITADTLNVRKGPGTSYEKVTTVKKGEAYTITKTSGNWGYLKSGLGWICLNGYTKKIK